MSKTKFATKTHHLITVLLLIISIDNKLSRTRIVYELECFKLLKTISEAFHLVCIASIERGILGRYCLIEGETLQLN